MFRQHPVLSIATTAYLAAVCWLTLNPSINTEESSWLWSTYRALHDYGPTHWVTFDGIEFAVNLVLFIPVGIFFVLLLGRKRWFWAILFGLVGACWIELAQFLWLPERIADVRDVVSNGIGIVVGVLLALLLTARSSRAVHPRAERVAAT